ncbi:MAG TPA: hypothetical protein ENN43_02200, partial [bacterium]|nr:hypothetical protein [bacterium]
ELESALKCCFASEKTLMRAIKNLKKKYGIGTVIVTTGKRGAIAYDGRKFYRAVPLKTKKAFSTVGCGDAFTAGIAYGIEKNGDIETCLRLGTAAAAANLKASGACFFKKEDVFGHLSAARVRRI